MPVNVCVNSFADHLMIQHAEVRFVVQQIQDFSLFPRLICSDLQAPLVCIFDQAVTDILRPEEIKIRDSGSAKTLHIRFCSLFRAAHKQIAGRNIRMVRMEITQSTVRTAEYHTFAGHSCPADTLCDLVGTLAVINGAAAVLKMDKCHCIFLLQTAECLLQRGDLRFLSMRPDRISAAGGLRNILNVDVLPAHSFECAVMEGQQVTGSGMPQIEFHSRGAVFQCPLE